MKLYISSDKKNLKSNKPETDTSIKQIYVRMERLFQTRFYCPSKLSLKRKLAEFSN